MRDKVNNDPLSFPRSSQRVPTVPRRLLVQRTHEMMLALDALRLELKDRPFEKSKMQIVKSWLDIPGIGTNK